MGSECFKKCAECKSEQVKHVLEFKKKESTRSFNLIGSWLFGHFWYSLNWLIICQENITYTNFLLNGDHWSDEAQYEVEADEEPVEDTLHRPSVKNEHERGAADRHRVVQ